MAHDIEQRTLALRTDDGETLDADLALPRDPVAAAMIAHPHPLMGGDRRNPVVDAMFSALASAGVAVVRFDFRGVGRSTGTHDQGRAERLDVRAALDAAAAQAPGVPLWSTGYSFGADVALSVDRSGLAGWIGVAPPLSALVADAVAALDERPVHLIVAAHDQFCSTERARAVTDTWCSTTVTDVPMADHFLTGRLDHVAELVVATITGHAH